MKRYLALICLSLMALMLFGGCSGSGSNSQTSISGTAALGAPMSGTATAVGANGKTAAVTIGPGGAFTITSADLTFPALVKADDGAGHVLYSWASAPNVTTNITPLTTLALILTDLPDNLNTLFANWPASAAGLTPLGIKAAQAVVNANLQTQFAAMGLDYKSYDFLTTPFTANNGGIDGVIHGLQFTFDYTADSLAGVVGVSIAGIGTPVSINPAIDTSAVTIGVVSPPAITSFNPLSGSAGDSITITGAGFDSDKAHMVVSFATNVAATIVSASNTQLVVTVPTGAVTGKITVTNGLTNLSVTSAADFTVTGGNTGGGGTDWTQRNYGSSFMLETVAYGNGTFVAAGFGNTIVTSSDGLTWTKRNAPDAYSYTLRSVIWDGTQFVLTGDVTFGAPAGTAPLIATSPDGTVWTRRSWNNSGGETALVGLTAAGGQVTVVGANGAILVSANGTNWTTQAAPTITGGYIAELFGVASSGTVRVAVGRDGFYQGLIIRSSDGATWSAAKTALTTFYPRNVLWNGSKFIAVGAANANMGATPVVMSSNDGLNWTTETLPAAVASAGFSLNNLTWTGSQFIVVGDDGAAASKRIALTSPDGVSWTVDKQWSTTGQINSLKGVAVSVNRWVAVGDSLWTKP